MFSFYVLSVKYPQENTHIPLVENSEQTQGPAKLFSVVTMYFTINIFQIRQFLF